MRAPCGLVGISGVCKQSRHCVHVTVVAMSLNLPKATYGGLWSLYTCRFKVRGMRVKQPGTKR